MSLGVECPGWPAPHVPVMVLKEGSTPASTTICPACEAVMLLLDAPSTPRVARFVERLAKER